MVVLTRDMEVDPLAGSAEFADDEETPHHDSGPSTTGLPEGMAMDVEDDDGGVGHMADEAKRRKERLRELKQKLMGGRAKTSTDQASNRARDAPLPKPVFRSYNPTDEKFQEALAPKARAIDIEEQIADTLQHSVVKPVVEDDVDLTSLAPRKPDWDLKRDVASKLAKLERRTHRAIAELILDRLKGDDEDGKGDLAAVVELSTNPDNRANLDDDDD